MKSKLAGLILLMGISMAAQAHNSRSFVPDEDSPSYRAALHSSAHGSPARFERGHFVKVHKMSGGHMRNADGDFDGCTGPIPEPGTYAMLLAGLGLMTTIARRKRLGR